MGPRLGQAKGDFRGPAGGSCRLPRAVSQDLSASQRNVEVILMAGNRGLRVRQRDLNANL